MVNFFLPEQPKRQPKREASRLKALAEGLQQSGQYKGNEMVSGRVVEQSPWEHLTRGLSTAAGGYFEGQAQRQLDQSDADSGKIFAEALEKMGTDMGEAAQILGQDPEQREAALKMYADMLSDQRKTEQMREMIGLRASTGGGNIPAAMQISRRMFELEQTMNNPNASPQDRFMAEREYNLLGQAAKTYGFDRGIGYGDGMQGYQDVYGQPSAPQGIPPINTAPPMMGGQAPENPLPPSGYAQDPVAAHAQAVAAQQQQIGVHPAQRPELAQMMPPVTPPAQPITPPSIAPIAGYGDATAQLAAQKKMEEGRASEIGNRQGENENLYRSMVSRMPQLEDTVERLSKLGQVATYTMGGQAFNMAARELGVNVPDAATARAEYISMVDNEILPLLRDTFGAQFTQREGESLKATLGNPNASPQEKDAVLRSFIRTKVESLASARRELDYGQSIPEYTPREVTIGGQPYNPLGQPQGQIAVNPQTGERLINRGNGWEPMQ
jgi:hypothetical protein